MYAIGHFALGYLTGKGSSKLLKTNLNVPLMLAVSVLPDVDLLLQQFNSNLFMHRGPTHSIVTFTVLMIPFFILYRKQALPYYFVLLSHSLIGDFFTGGIEIIWPLSQDWAGNMLIGIQTLADVIAELSLFVVATAIMFRAGDLQRLLKPRKANLALVIAFFAALGPMLTIASPWGAALPIELFFPSLFWVVIFGYSIVAEFRAKPPSLGKK